MLDARALHHGGMTVYRLRRSPVSRHLATSMDRYSPSCIACSNQYQWLRHQEPFLLFQTSGLGHGTKVCVFGRLLTVGIRKRQGDFLRLRQPEGVGEPLHVLTCGARVSIHPLADRRPCRSLAQARFHVVGYGVRTTHVAFRRQLVYHLSERRVLSTVHPNHLLHQLCSRRINTRRLSRPTYEHSSGLTLRTLMLPYLLGLWL